MSEGATRSMKYILVGERLADYILYIQKEDGEFAVHTADAAVDLGATPTRAFLPVTLPLSMPGVIAGSMLVFIPAVGEFVIPRLLGGTNSLMIGRVLWDEFFTARNWPGASAVAVCLLIVLVVPIMIFQRYQLRETGGVHR